MKKGHRERFLQSAALVKCLPDASLSRRHHCPLLKGEMISLPQPPLLAGFAVRRLWIQRALILSLLLPPGSNARHRDKIVSNSRSTTGLCISETPFDALAKQIAHCASAPEVGQNPYLHFIKE